MSKDYEGTFCLVVHSHLPWLAHHGSWPVGEEWLYQAWAHSYLPMVDLLRRFADEGRQDVLTLGMTPVQLTCEARLLEPFEREFADRLEHPVALLAEPPGAAAQEALVKQRSESVEIGVAHRLRGLQRAAAAEHAEPCEQLLLVFVEQVI